MATLRSSVRIERPRESVFAYVTDPTRFSEWQHGVVESHLEGEPGVGTRCVDVRQLMGRRQTSTSEISEFDPPARWAVRGLDGPVRANVEVTVEASGSDASSVTIDLTFAGVGIGRVIVPLARRQAAREMPGNMANLKRQLEGGSS